MVKKVSLSDETIELLNNQGEGLSYDQIIQKGVKAVEPELQEQKKKQQEEKEAKAKQKETGAKEDNKKSGKN